MLWRLRAYRRCAGDMVLDFFLARRGWPSAVVWLGRRSVRLAPYLFHLWLRTVASRRLLLALRLFGALAIIYSRGVAGVVRGAGVRSGAGRGRMTGRRNRGGGIMFRGL